MAQPAITDSIKIGYWIERLDEATKQFVASFGKLTPEELNWKPAPNKWSIGQCVDHIIKTNEIYFPLIRDMLTGKYQATFIQKLPFLPDLFGSMLLKSIESSSKKMGTFPIFEPSTEQISSDIIKDFAQHQEHLKTLIENTQHLDHEKIIISSPANRFVTYSLATALDILVTHEFRHLNQALNVMQLEQAKDAA